MEPEQAWHGRPVDVGIEDADLPTERPQAKREIDRNG
jgi:hypothetical protein